MAFIDWLNGSQHKFIFTDGQKTQHRLTGSEFGSECVGWAQSMTRIQMLKLASLADAKPRSDILRKIKAIPLYANAWVICYYSAVFSSYSVVRLGVSNTEFSNIMKGMAHAARLFRSAEHPSDQQSRAMLVEAMGRSTALVLEAAGSAQAHGDKFQFGVSALLQDLLNGLESDYQYVDVADGRLDQGGSLKVINPGIEASSNISSRQLIVYTLGNSAEKWINETDQSKSLFYL